MYFVVLQCFAPDLNTFVPGARLQFRHHRCAISACRSYSHHWLACRTRYLRFETVTLLGEKQCIPGHYAVYLDDVVRLNLLADNQVGHREDHMPLTGAFEMPCAPPRVQAFIE